MSAVRRLLVVLAAAVVIAAGAPVAGQVPAGDVEVIIAIDTSASMRPAIEDAKAAANAFIASMPPAVRIGVETFADQVTVLATPTTDRALLGRQIASITAGGDTALYDAVVGASGNFTPAATHKVLVLLSDGKDEGSAATLDDARAASAGLQVEAISLQTPATDLASLMALGQVTPADDPSAVAAAFARVSGLIVEVIEPAPTTATTTPTTTTTTTAPPAVPEPAAAPLPPVRATDSSPSPVWLWLGGAGVFAGLLLLGLTLIPHRMVSRARLGIDAPRGASGMGVRTMSAIDEALVRTGTRADLGSTLALAGIAMRPAEFVGTVGLAAFLVGLVGLWLGGPVLGLAVAMVVGIGARAVVIRRRDQRRAAFADQLPEVLQLVTTSLRSGYGITQALESVAEDAEEPARSEFANVLAETRLGRDMSESLYALADRMDSKDLEWVVAAIDINRDAGGNLSEVLQKVSTTIRERGRIARQVRTLTAEGRLSARILTALPFLMLLWQWRVNPANFSLLTSGVGLVALAVAGLLLVLGTWWVRHIVNSVAL
jgi:Flp pilus assembly protein TadB